MGAVPQDVLLLLEHPPVVTLGRSTKAAHLTTSPAALAQRGIELYESERGGDVTFHGPGQLVGYPIIDLRRHRRDLHWYLRRVEEVLIVALGQIGLPCERRGGFTGVWTRGLRGDAAQLRKIASIGVHARDWVTWHGFAVNITTDLSFFDLIVPCGIAGVEMTSVGRELGTNAPGIDAVGGTIARTFAGLFDLESMPAPDNLKDCGTARSLASDRGATVVGAPDPDTAAVPQETAPA
ncbi:MAG: lipoyl(octanoyl) transferase LipB [Gemmatimonadaceae bacterium]